MSGDVFLHVEFVYHVCAMPGEAKRIKSSGTELAHVNHHVGAGDWIGVLWESSQWQPSHLSSFLYLKSSLILCPFQIGFSRRQYLRVLQTNLKMCKHFTPFCERTVTSLRGSFWFWTCLSFPIPHIILCACACLGVFVCTLKRYSSMPLVLFSRTIFRRWNHRIYSHPTSFLTAVPEPQRSWQL